MSFSWEQKLDRLVEQLIPVEQRLSELDAAIKFNKSISSSDIGLAQTISGNVAERRLLRRKRDRLQEQIDSLTGGSDPGTVPPPKAYKEFAATRKREWQDWRAQREAELQHTC